VSFKQRIQPILRKNPFKGSDLPSRVSLFRFGRPSTPFPHLWNYREPIRILDTYFYDVENKIGFGKHNRYLHIIGLPPVLVTRDPALIKPILLNTSDKEGHFDRDTLPTDGIARATGEDSLLYSNGPQWRIQKKLAAPSFGKSKLFQPEKFGAFEKTFRKTAAQRLELLREQQASSGEKINTLQLEPEINVVMLEMLINNFFGSEVEYAELRDRYVPSLVLLIDSMVSDTIAHSFFRTLNLFGEAKRKHEQAKADFEELTDIALSGRSAGRGMWSQFKSEATDEQLRSNIRVFLAGAMEATSSFASWALSHLACAPAVQEKIYREVESMDVYDPGNLAQAQTLRDALQETLRLTPSLYFLPRRATTDTLVQLADERTIIIPKGTHVVLDVWHANRCEDFWGENVSGYSASEFAPERWAVLKDKGFSVKDMQHFGFGFGPRTCPGISLGMLEVGLVVGAFVKLFKFTRESDNVPVRAGVSTKPKDGLVVNVELRQPYC